MLNNCKIQEKTIQNYVFLDDLGHLYKILIIFAKI